jgi:hypothetical protein
MNASNRISLKKPTWWSLFRSSPLLRPWVAASKLHTGLQCVGKNIDPKDHNLRSLILHEQNDLVRIFSRLFLAICQRSLPWLPWIFQWKIRDNTQPAKRARTCLIPTELTVKLEQQQQQTPCRSIQENLLMVPDPSCYLSQYKLQYGFMLVHMAK